MNYAMDPPPRFFDISKDTFRKGSKERRSIKNNAEDKCSKYLHESVLR